MYFEIFLITLIPLHHIVIIVLPFHYITRTCIFTLYNPVGRKNDLFSVC